MVIYHTNRTADVSPFLPALGTAEKVQIIQGQLPMIILTVRQSF
jgi:hypothetical protein